MREPATLLETSPEARPDFPPQVFIFTYKIRLYL